MNPLRALGLWLAGETKSRSTSETLPKWQLGKPHHPLSPVVTNADAISASRKSGVVFACIRLIADAATSVPLKVYRDTPDGWEEAPDHPLQALLDHPNTKLTRRRLYYRAIQHLLLNGNAIWFKVRVPKSGPPTQLWPINPDQVRPVPSGDAFVSHYELTVGGKRENIDARDVVHLQLENPEDPYWGIGPLQAAMLDIALYAGNKSWNLRTVNSGAVVPGVLEVPEDLSGEQFKTLRAQLDNRTFGMDDAGRDLILGSGMKYHRMSLTGEEIGFLESMRFGREEISMIFGVPPAMLTPDNATLANVDAYNKQFWETTIVPLNTGVADLLTHLLVPDFERQSGRLVIEHDYALVPAMQDSFDDQAETAERLKRAGFSLAGINRVLDLGFEEDELSEPQPAALAVGVAGEVRRGRGPTRQKALTSDQLRALAIERDRERQAWEEEVATRVNDLFSAERDLVVERWRGSGSMTGVESAVRANQPAWVALLTATYVEAGRHFAEREHARLSPKARKDFDPQAIAIEWAERHAAARVVNIADTTIEELAGIISRGLTPDPSTGHRLTVDEIARELADTYDTWAFTGPHPSLTIDQRAMTIARTELGTAMNHGHDVGARRASEEYGLELEKGWASAGDDRVRASHAELHGVFVSMDEPFANGLMYPGDPSGPAEEVVNCRCVLVHQPAR